MAYFVDRVWRANVDLLRSALLSGTYTMAPAGDAVNRQRLMRASAGWSASGVATEVMRLNVKTSTGADFLDWIVHAGNDPLLTSAQNSALVSVGAYYCHYGGWIPGGAAALGKVEYKALSTIPGPVLFYYNFSGPQAQELFERFSYQNATFADIAAWLNTLP